MKKATATKPKGQPDSDLPKLSQPAVRALTAAGYVRLEQFTTLTETQVKQLHGIGPHALAQLRRALKEKGWSFAGEA